MMKRPAFAATLPFVLCAALAGAPVCGAQPVVNGKCRITFPSPMFISLSN